MTRDAALLLAFALIMLAALITSDGTGLPYWAG